MSHVSHDEILHGHGGYEERGFLVTHTQSPLRPGPPFLFSF